MWRLCKLGYRHEPALIVAAFTLALARGAAGCAAGALVQAARRGRRSQGDWARCASRSWRSACPPRRRGSCDRQHARAAPVPRQGDDRARVARRDAAGVDRDHRAPGASRVSRSPCGAAQSGVHARPHVHVAVLDVWMDPAARRHDRAARVHSSGAGAAGALRAAAGAARRRGGRRSSEARYERGAPASRLARHLFDVATTAAPGKEVRVTGIGDRLVRERRQAWESGNTPDRRGALGLGRLAHRWRGRSSAPAYVGAIVFVSSGLAAPAGDVLLALAAGSRLSFYVGATVGEIGFLRGVWMDAARRLAWLEDYAASLRRDGRSARASAAGRGHPLRARLVRLSRHRRGSCSTTSISICRQARSSRSSARTERASRRSSSCWRRCTSRRVAASSSIRPTSRASPPSTGARGSPAPSRISSASSSAPGRPSGIGDLPAARRRARGRHGREPRRRRRRDRAAAGGARHAARADVARRRAR